MESLNFEVNLNAAILLQSKGVAILLQSKRVAIPYISLSTHISKQAI